jgi:hypothetical protein
LWNDERTKSQVYQRYAITIAHIGQIGYLGGKLVLFLESMDENAKKNSELIA